MKATKIFYKKLFNLGNFQHEQIGIELEIEEGEKAEDVLREAKKFVESKGSPNELIKRYEEAKRIVQNPEGYLYKDVEEAKRFLEKFESADFPF